MSVEVVHYGKDPLSSTLITTTHESNSWTIDPNSGALTVGNSFGNPEASYHGEHWRTVKKTEDEISDTEED